MAEIENTATIRVVADASGVEAGLRPAVDAAHRAETAIGQVGSGAAASSRNVEASTRNIINAIQRVSAEAQAGGRNTAAYFEAIGRQRGDPAVLAPYIAQLRAVEQAQASAARSAGASAGQINAAMRTLPAQFHDIVTSLQGGQRPLTVLTQQGGQLADQFGSAGAAARALGGYVLGLINPYTVAAGAVAGLAVAYKSGAEEVSAYAKALALTGNAAGATADQLNELARQVGAVSGNRGAAAEAITALAGTGQVSVDNLKQFGAVAADVQKVIGRSVADTAADFAKLGKAPLSALTEINDKYHFITAATYAQVKALQDQGKAAEAADVAQKAYADGISAQRQKVADSLTDWERGWIRIKAATSGAVDAAIDFASGRGATNSEKITGLLEERGKIEENLARARARNLPADVAAYNAELEANKRAINAIRDKDQASKDAAKSEGDAAQATEARNKWLTEGDKYLTRAAQLERDVTKARNEGAAAHMSEVDIEKRVGDIRKSYSDIFNAGIESNIAALKRRDQVADVLEQRELARIQAERTLGGMSESEAINATAAAELAAYDRKAKLLESELSITKRKANSIKEQADLEGQIAANSEQRRSREIQQETELLLLAEKRRQLSDALYIKGVTAAIDERDSILGQVKAQKEQNEQIGLAQPALTDLIALRIENTAAQKDERAAAIEAIDPNSSVAKSYREQADALRELASEKRNGDARQAIVDTAKEAQDSWKRASEQIEQSLTDALMRGFESGKSLGENLVDTLKNMFGTLVLRPVIQASLAPVAQGITSVLGSNSSAAPAGSSNSLIGSAQQASSLYSAGKTIYAGFQSGITSTLGGYVTTLGNTFGNSAMAAFGSGMSGGAGTGAVMAELSQGTAAGATATANAGAVGAGASSAGYAIPIAGWIAFGMSMSDRFYKQGWDANNGSVNSLGKVVNAPMFAANNILKGIGLSDSAANILVGMGPISKLFGRKNPKIESQGIEGTVDGSGFSGDAFANIIEEGGWFRGDKRYTKNADLSTEQDSALDSTIKSMMVAVDGFASTLGVSTDSITGYSKQIKLELTGDATKDQEAIAKLFGDIGDELSSKLVPNLAQFTQTGETASTTLQRLAGDFQATTSVAQLLGKTAAEAFGTAGIESAAARERLVTLAGGTSTLTSQAQSYSQNYLTDDEKLAPVKKAVDEAMASLGLSAVQTRDQFKAIVNSLDLTTDAGAKEFVSLMQLSDAFAQVHAATDDAAKAAAVLQERQGLQDQLDQLTMTSAQLLEKQRNALDESNRALFDQINAVQAQKTTAEAAAETIKAAQEAAAASIQAAQEAMAAEMKSLGDGFQGAYNGAKDAAKALRDFNDSLVLGNLSALDPEEKYRAAKAQYQSNPSDTQAAQAFLQASKDRGVDDFFYQRDFADVQAKTSAGATAADDQADAIRNLWLAIQQPATPVVTPMPAAVLNNLRSGSISGSSADQASVAQVNAKVDKLIDALGGKLDVIANSTSQTADHIERVTEGGNGMVLAS